MPAAVPTDSARRLLLVHAHPDDETISSGATMARYAAEGAHVTLLTCTLGELGEVLVPELAGLAAERADQLGGYRIGELAAAMRALGVSDHRFLGGPGCWRDSGMMGTAGNADPRAFWACASDPERFERAVAQATAVVREVRPQVVVTYDENGGYGHPDHIMAHRVAMAAVERAARPGGPGEPWSVSKLYWTALPKSVLQRGIDALRAADGPTFFDGVESADDLPMGDPDDEVTTAVDGRVYAAAKDAAMRAHATQIAVDGPFFALSNNIGQPLLSVEYFRLVRGRVAGERDADGRETDLFAGIELVSSRAVQLVDTRPAVRHRGAQRAAGADVRAALRRLGDRPGRGARGHRGQPAAAALGAAHTGPPTGGGAAAAVLAGTAARPGHDRAAGGRRLRARRAGPAVDLLRRCCSAARPPASRAWSPRVRRRASAPAGAGSAGERLPVGLDQRVLHRRDRGVGHVGLDQLGAREAGQLALQVGDRDVADQQRHGGAAGRHGACAAARQSRPSRRCRPAWRRGRRRRRRRRR